MAIDPILFKKVPRQTNMFTGLEVMSRRVHTYHKMTADEMLQALERIGIHITKQDILNIFTTNYSTEDTINMVFDHYPETADALDARGLYINSDIIIELVDRTVIEEYGITHIPDPSIIGEYLDDLFIKDNDYTFNDIIAITKSINDIKKYYKERNLDDLFAKAIGLDTMGELYDLLEILNKKEHSPQDTLDLLDQVMMIAKNYSFNSKDELLTSAFNLAIKNNKDKANDLKKTMKETVKR